jgi:hypothetical protein
MNNFDECNECDEFDWPGEINIPCGMPHLKFKSRSFPKKNSSNKLERLKCVHNSENSNSLIDEFQSKRKFYNKYLQAERHLIKQSSEKNKKLVSKERKRYNIDENLNTLLF